MIGIVTRTSFRIAAWSPRTKRVIVFLVLAAAFALPLRGLLRNQGPPMEEGFMLVFPERVLHGDFPNRDFLHLYGPGSLWALAGWMKVLGVTLTAERLFGLLQQIGVVAGVYWLARAWGRRLGLACALLALLFIVPPLGLTALAWIGGVALGLIGLNLTLVGRRAVDVDPRRAARYLFWGGLVSAGALLFRLDLVIAVGLGALGATAGLSWAAKRKFATGLGIGVLAYVIQLVTAGPYNTFKGMVLDPVVYLRGGRRLPIPPSWNHLDGFLQRSGAIQPPKWPLPHLETSQQLFVWFFVMIAVVVAVPIIGRFALRRRPSSRRARVLFAAGLFGLGMLPQGIQRVDSAHFSWVSCVSLALLPVAVVELVRLRRSTTPRWTPALTIVAIPIAIVLLFPHFTGWSYADFVAQTFGRHRLAFAIERNGRTFYYGRDDVAQAARELLAEVPKVAKPGDKLFVGPTDLRKTPYSDAYLYYLLPEYPPGTYFIEMDPGVANRAGSRMPSDLAHSQVAILSGVWNDWDEPNDARKFGSNESNLVLRRDFCLVKTFGVRPDDKNHTPLYELYINRSISSDPDGTGRECPTN
ncbi:MAG: hypothetical protein JJE46_02785 [Acidimicrobiia bacterium]|nr:hypothetical protein [Acidimicrobiia bacterium]